MISKLISLLLIISINALAQEEQKPKEGVPQRKIEFPKPVPAPRPIESSLKSLTNLPFKMILPGVFEIGGVRMDKQRRTISFPGTVNMSVGPLEYLLIAKWGKAHESVLRTDVEPFHIHVAMLMIDASNAPPVDSGAAPGGGGQFIADPSKETIPGDRILIEVGWQEAGKEIDRPGEQLVFNVEKQRPMTNAVWVYNGSRIWSGKFMAQLSGSIVSLITDPDAQVNSMTLGHDNDRIWTVNTNGIPAVGTPVRITFRVPTNEK
jgi:hypothetical protein